MILFSPEEIAMFIQSCVDLSNSSEAEIEEALDAWREHMIAGGFDVGREIGLAQRAHKPDTQSGEI